MAALRPTGKKPPESQLNMGKAAYSATIGPSIAAAVATALTAMRLMLVVAAAATSDTVYNKWFKTARNDDWVKGMKEAGFGFFKATCGASFHGYIQGGNNIVHAADAVKDPYNHHPSSSPLPVSANLMNPDHLQHGSHAQRVASTNRQVGSQGMAM